MGLSDWTLGVIFGVNNPPVRYWIGLAHEGKEISDGGYDRQPVLRTQWSIRGGRASALVAFGPFDDTVLFDATWIFAENELIDRIPIEDGPIRLTPGTTIVDHSVEVNFSGGA